MISFEFDNYTEPVAMIAKKQEEDRPLKMVNYKNKKIIIKRKK